MSSPRLVFSSVLLRASRSTAPRVGRQFRFLQAPVSRTQLPSISRSQLRCYSQDSKPNRIYSFKEIQAHIQNPDPNRILIDAREPGELQSTGTIPGSLNIPVSSKPDSFFIPEEEFEDRFGFERPDKGKEVVFYCKSGVRSRAAAELARQAGWSNVAEYKGSWLDWEKNGGEKENVR